jgi:hypothetical protein
MAAILGCKTIFIRQLAEKNEGEVGKAQEMMPQSACAFLL